MAFVIPKKAAPPPKKAAPPPAAKAPVRDTLQRAATAIAKVPLKQPPATSGAQPDDALAALRALQQRLSAKGGRGGDDAESQIWSIVEGKNKARFLPFFDAAGTPDPVNFYREVKVHYKIGPEEKTVLCTCGLPGGCRIDVHYEKLRTAMNSKFKARIKAAKSEKEKDALKAESKQAWYDLREAWGIGPDGHGTSQYLSVVVPYSTTNPNNITTKPRIFLYRTTVMNALLSQRLDNPSCGDFTDLDTGRPMIVKRVGTGKDTKYEVFPGDRCKLHSVIRGIIERGELPSIDVLVDDFFPTLTVEQQDLLIEGQPWDVVMGGEPAADEEIAEEDEGLPDEEDGLADEEEPADEEDPPPPPPRKAVAKPAAAPPASKSAGSIRDRLLQAAKKK